MSVEPVCIGDSICLYSEETDGFLYSLQSSEAFSEVAVGSSQDKVKPLVPDPQVVSFTVCVANRYKQTKRLRKFTEKKTGEDSNAQPIIPSKAKSAAKAENEDNQTEMTRQTGRKLLYGQIIQLRHQFTRKYIHASSTLTSRSESNNMLVELLPWNAKHAQFRVMPRYKVKAEGDVVFIDDQVVFESMKSPGQYLHVSQTHFSSTYVYSDAHELCLSVRRSGFSMTPQKKPEKEHQNILRCGQPIRLFHKEIEAYLVAEGLFDDEVTEDVHFRLRPVNQTNPKNLFPSTSAITYWQFESVDKSVESGLILWEQRIRIRHMITRKYLKITDEGEIRLEDSNEDPMTVFRLHPVIKERDIEYETFCRIEHVVTKKWISTSTNQEPYIPRRAKENREGGDHSMASLKWTQAQLVQVTSDDVMKYDDAFTIQLVKDDHVHIYNFVAGCVPSIQKLISQRNAGKTLDTKQAHNYVQALDEMCKFMIVDGEHDKNRQKLFRNFRLVELLVKLLQTPLQEAPDIVHLQRVFAKAYDVLCCYLRGNSRKNELYIARHLDFFHTQFDLEGDVGPKAVRMVMEIMRDNRKVVDRITKDDIDKFVNLLTREKNFQYLELLSVLCVCDGMALPENQEHITTVWLRSDKKNVVYNTDLGQKIDLENNVVYVSTDNTRTWKALHDFAAQRDESPEEKQNFFFLKQQLDLFGKLCFGRNKFAIDTITQDLDYLTWEEAFTCLSNEQLPDSLRIEYCDLVIAMFVDIDENVSVLDRIKLTFVYDEVSDNDNAGGELEQTMLRSKVTTEHFPKIRDWISIFLDKNKNMTASLMGRNMLTEQVLRLVHYLVKYGYYGNTNDIKKLMTHLLDLMDGRTKKLVIQSGGSKGNIMADDTELQKQRDQARFAISQETKAVVDAKHQAMEILDLLFNFLSNTRLQQFVFEFKNSKDVEAQHQAMDILDLNPLSSERLEQLMLETYQRLISGKENLVRKSKLAKMFSRTDYLTENSDLVAILMDLSEYKYDKLLTKSMALLNRYYSTRSALFNQAVQAQVLITPKSVEVYKEVLSILPTLQRLRKSKLSNDTGTQLAGIVDQLTSFCCLKNEPEEPHPMNQRILYNFNILGDTFGILAKEYDVKLADQYQGMKVSLQASFRLLKAIARGNTVVQGRLFDRLDFLLQVKGAEPEMAEAVVEIFSGNMATCMKVSANQIQTIMQLVAEHGAEAPQFLDLLNAIVKLEELNLPLKRNQGYVMTYFMQYRAEVSGPLELDQDGRRNLLHSNNDIKKLRYMLSLVNLLSTCAEGENRYIESICQTIFTLDELLQIITDDKLSNIVKKPFLRYALWVYMNTDGGIIESGAGDLPHDAKIWKLWEMTVSDLDKLNSYISSHPQETKRLLREIPSIVLSESVAPKLEAAAQQAKLQEDGEAPLIVVTDAIEVVPVIEITPSTDVIDVHEAHGSLHYYFDAMMPSLQNFFRSCYQPGCEKEAGIVDKLAKQLLQFVDHVGPAISDKIRLKTMVSCVGSVWTSSAMSVTEIEVFQDKYGRPGAEPVSSDARKRYIEEFSKEEELNNQLNVFVKSFADAYIKTLIVADINEAYNIDGYEELPLGREFQDHMAVFITDSESPKEKYALAIKLIDQLMVSGNLSLTNEEDRLAQNDLDIKCFQLLRGLIHNEIVQLPTDMEGHEKKTARQMKQISAIQMVLEDNHAILKVLPHLAKNQDRLVREVLSFMAAMLYGGNEKVQQGLIDYFCGTRSEQFFYIAKTRVDMSTTAVKQQRALRAQYKVKVEEAVETDGALKKAIAAEKTTGHIDENGTRKARASELVSTTVAKFGAAWSRLKAGSKRRSNRESLDSNTASLLADGPSNAAENSKDIEAHKGSPVDMELGEVIVVKDAMDLDDEGVVSQERKRASEEVDLKYQDDGYIELVLKVLGLMCDDQNGSLQDYLREQPDNIKTYNLVGETAQYLQLLYSDINKDTISLIIQVFRALVEFCLGSAFNQAVVFDKKVIDYINYILRNKQYESCKDKDILELQSSIQQLVKAICEENRSTKDSSQEVMETLDMNCIHDIMLKLYCQISTHSHDDLQEKRTQIAFGYYHLIRRLEDINPDYDIKNMRAQADSCCKEPGFVDRAWRYFEGSTMSIEIVKDDQLQKAYFHVQDKTVLREEVKERFNYEVDRSTSTNKLREFLDWSNVIMDDIKYQKKILSNPVSKFFVKGGYWLNVLVIIISFLIAILILSTWIDPAEVVSPNPHLLYMGDNNASFTRLRPAYRSALVTSSSATMNMPVEMIIMYILAGIHNILSLCIIISFFLSNRPQFPTMKSIKRPFGNLSSLSVCDKSTTTEQSDENDDDDDNGKPKLRDQFFSFKTLYYITFLVMSALGTAYYGYFFAFHLLHIAQNNQLLKRVILAVTKHSLSLLWVFILGLIFLYIYTLLVFGFFRDLHSKESGTYCGEMHQCFVNFIHKGMITGVYEMFNEIKDLPTKDYQWNIGKFFLDFTFFIIMTTIGLNIIFGIIVDTFSELRDSKWMVDEDMRKGCFICSQESYHFERRPVGFEKHIKQEHYQWAYLFFFIHLRNTRVNDYSAIELYVHKHLENRDINFFPQNRAMSLEDEEDSNEARMDTLLQRVEYLVAKMKEQETLKSFEEKKREEKEWMRKNTIKS